MRIPQDRNTRAEAMWRIISQRVDFRGKRVIDLGCGTGDFLWRAYVAGAEMVVGFDKSISRTRQIRQAVEELSSLFVYHDKIEDLMEIKSIDHDIAMCFSVLPYLDDIPATMKWMAKNFPICLIECQYNGDGPGLSNIGSDTGMAQYLINEGEFNQVIPIGKTLVEGRKNPDGNPVFRTIWMASVESEGLE